MAIRIYPMDPATDSLLRRMSWLLRWEWRLELGKPGDQPFLAAHGDLKLPAGLVSVELCRNDDPSALIPPDEEPGIRLRNGAASELQLSNPEACPPQVLFLEVNGLLVDFKELDALLARAVGMLLERWPDAPRPRPAPKPSVAERAWYL